MGTQIILIALCNVVFSNVYAKRLDYQIVRAVDLHIKGEYIVFGIYVAMIIPLIYIGCKFDYVSVKDEMVHSSLSNFKTIVAGVYVAYLVLWGKSKKTIFMFLLFLVLMLVEKSRWYFLSVLIATVIYLVKERIVRTRFIVIGAIVIALLMSYVGLYRMGGSPCEFIALTHPFFIEGDCGSYMILQTYDLVYSGALKYCTFFVDYFVDPVIYMVPRIVFLFWGLDKDSSTLFAKFVADHQAFLAEPYAPVGGFHYIAQASSALPFIGPLIVTYCFARICVYFENNSTNGLTGKFYYYIFTAGFCFVFIKTQFHQTIKYGLTLFLPAYLIFKAVQYVNRKKTE